MAETDETPPYGVIATVIWENKRNPGARSRSASTPSPDRGSASWPRVTPEPQVEVAKIRV